MGLASISHSFRTGPRAGPVLFAFLWLTLAPPFGVPAGAERKRPRVTDAILGIRVGSSLAKARRAIASVEPQAVNETGESEGSAEPDRDEPPGARKEMWTFHRTSFRSLVLKVDPRDRVVWVTGFLRPGREIPFERLGDLAIATRATDSQAIWNVRTAGGNYRLIARGPNRKASVISLLSLALPPVE